MTATFYCSKNYNSLPGFFSFLIDCYVIQAFQRVLLNVKSLFAILIFKPNFNCSYLKKIITKLTKLICIQFKKYSNIFIQLLIEDIFKSDITSARIYLKEKYLAKRLSLCASILTIGGGNLFIKKKKEKYLLPLINFYQ